jgi:hypothetical protein
MLRPSTLTGSGRLLAFAIICSAGLALSPSPSLAQVDGEHHTPGNSCPSGATAGQANTPDWDTFFECNGSSQWQRGPYFFGASSDSCDASHEGLTRYDTTAHNLYFCNGTTWQAVNAAGAGGITPGCGANGTLSTQQATTINVAAGCTVQFKVWGAGGGSGCYSGGGWGGGGGYATITLGPLGSATTYYLVVGGGGEVADTSYSPGLTGYLGGPASGGACGAGSGGSASGVWTGSYGGTPVLIAGGGGGASRYGSGSAAPSGSQVSPGADGGSGVNDGDVGGGGGGGYLGGVGAAGQYYSAAGGSDYIAAGGTTLTGSGATPGNAGDSNRPTNAGEGGANPNGWGNDGAIYYSTY